MNSKYERNNIVIVIILSLVFIISATLIYFIYFNKEEHIDNKESLFVKVEDKNVIKSISNIIDDNNLYIFAKYEKNIDDINTINNNEKLELAFNTIRKDNEDISIYDISNYFKNIFKTTIYWNTDNIKCSCGNDLYIYDIENKKYTYNIEHIEHENEIEKPNYKILDIEKKNDIYIVKMNYIWNKVIDDKLNIYVNYNDLLEDKVLFSIDINEEDKEDLLEQNYNKYKDKLYTYVYTFEIVNNKYLLTSFRYEK